MILAASYKIKFEMYKLCKLWNVLGVTDVMWHLIYLKQIDV